MNRREKHVQNLRCHRVCAGGSRQIHLAAQQHCPRVSYQSDRKSRLGIKRNLVLASTVDWFVVFDSNTFQAQPYFEQLGNTLHVAASRTPTPASHLSHPLPGRLPGRNEVINTVRVVLPKRWSLCYDWPHSISRFLFALSPSASGMYCFQFVAIPCWASCGVIAPEHTCLCSQFSI